VFSYFLYHSKSTRLLTLQLQVKITSAAAEHRCLKSAHEQKAEMAEALRGVVVRLEDEVRAATARAEASMKAAVTQEAAVCSLTFEKLSLVEALQAADLRYAIHSRSLWAMY
jgi:thiamine biosynthesis lipoprotein ApbE